MFAKVSIEVMNANCLSRRIYLVQYLSCLEKLQNVHAAHALHEDKIHGALSSVAFKTMSCIQHTHKHYLSYVWLWRAYPMVSFIFFQFEVRHLGLHPLSIFFLPP